MALLKCPDCGKLVSPRAKVCPECGCPAEFFEENAQAESSSKSEAKVEVYKEFKFNNNVIRYPENAELFAGLFGDFMKIAFDKSKQLVAIYKNLGNADAIARNFVKEAQRLVDEEINVVLKNLYSKGCPMTLEQFKNKYSEEYPLEYDFFMDPFIDRYNDILGIKKQMEQKRQASYDNRTRWSGGGFGMKGAIKGAVQAGVLNAGSSMISGLGNAVVATANEGTIERKKQALFNNNDVRTEVCSGMIVCMQGLFYAYTDELDLLGKLGNRISMDYELAEAKLEAVLSHEKDKDKIFATVIECLGLYPASRKFYETSEIELESCQTWNDFKEYWHLSFMYKEDDAAFLKSDAKIDNKCGTLRLVKDVLVFDGKNPSDSKKIPVGSIKSIEKERNYFQLGLKGKFLLISIETPIDDTWIKALTDAINGQYTKIDINELSKTMAESEQKMESKADTAKKYIVENYTAEQKNAAVMYYMREVGVSAKDARSVVNQIFPQEESKPVNTYPGTEELDNNLFKGERVVKYTGGESVGYYTILTTRELIYVDTKKGKEDRYDIFKISRMKSTFLGMVMTFKYAGSFLEKSVPVSDIDGYMEKIKNMQKGIFE